MDKNPTKDEHFNPVAYLECFGIEMEKKNKKGQLIKVFRYDRKNPQKSTFVSPDTQCVETNLYEIKGPSGEIVNINAIENNFHYWESPYKGIISAIETRACRIPQNFRDEFLDNGEIEFIAEYMAVQLIRMPEIIDEASQVCQDFFNLASKQEANKVAKMVALPSSLSNRNLPFFRVVEWWKSRFIEMSSTIVYDIERKYITCKWPIYIKPDTKNTHLINKVVFPLSSSLCLLLEAENNGAKKNDIYFADEKARDYINSCVVRIKRTEDLFAGYCIDEAQVKHWER